MRLPHTGRMRVAMYLRIIGTESWRLATDADAGQLQATLANAMGAGTVVQASVLDEDDTPRELAINGRNLVTAIITDDDYTLDPAPPGPSY
jgi:hypothetical protein